jgi:hypothetical protein
MSSFIQPHDGRDITIMRLLSRGSSKSLLKNSFGILNDHNILGLFIAGDSIC